MKSNYEVDFVFGSCMFIKKEVFDQIGGFDENYFLFTEETDLCYRIKKETDYKIIYWNEVNVIHLKSQITGRDKIKRFRLSYESKLIFFNKSYSRIRVMILKYFIVLMFWIKRSVILGKNNNDQQLKDTYSYIINYYLNFKLVK